MFNAFRNAARLMDAPRVQRRAVFGGATGSRLYADFQAGIYSPDIEIRMAGRLMRARARMLVRDNPHASGFLNELANNVVGPDGILLEAHVKSADGKKAKASNQSIESGWLDWGRPRHACVDRRTSWRDLQRLAIRTVAMDGECFFRKIPYFRNRHAFALQFIDADQVDEFYNIGPTTGQNEIRSGVEIDEYGAPVAYYVWSRQLSDLGPRVRLRIPAEEIIHLFVQYRGQQTRGVTWFAPALLNLKMLDGYTEAELVAARTAAAKMGFITNITPEAIEAYDAPADDETERFTDASPGSFEQLAPGEQVQLFDPKHPSVAFKDFTKAVLRGVARGLNMAYTTLTGDLEAVNYSSIRAGLLSERDWYRTLQRWMIEHCHSEVYDAWLPNALLAPGVLTVDSRLVSDFRDVRWRPRGWKWVNPKDDLIAAKLAIDLGLDSRTRLAGETGRDWEEIIDELAHEIDVSETAGVDVTGDQSGGSGAKARSPHQRRVRALFQRLVAGEISKKAFYARYERLLLASGSAPFTVAARARRQLRALPTGTGE